MKKKVIEQSTLTAVNNLSNTKVTKKIIDKITIKKGDEKVRTIAVAKSRLITEINIKIFIDKKPMPLKKLKTKNLLFKFLKIDRYSLVNKIRINRGITPAIFLKTAS